MFLLEATQTSGVGHAFRVRSALADSALFLPFGSGDMDENPGFGTLEHI